MYVWMERAPQPVLAPTNNALATKPRRRRGCTSSLARAKSEGPESAEYIEGEGRSSKQFVEPRRTRIMPSNTLISIAHSPLSTLEQTRSSHKFSSPSRHA